MCNSENPQGVSESMPINSNGAVSSLATSIGEIPPDAIVFGHSEVMQALRQRMDKVASANVPVLIQGESGTGKDIIARMVHGLSPWRTGPYVKVNCPAIPGTLLESELFGYEKGAFTGAYGSKPGRVEQNQGIHQTAAVFIRDRARYRLFARSLTRRKCLDCCHWRPFRIHPSGAGDSAATLQCAGAHGAALSSDGDRPRLRRRHREPVLFRV